MIVVSCVSKPFPGVLKYGLERKGYPHLIPTASLPRNPEEFL